jgi:cell wall-associated NlpC family hydrolase
MEAMMRRRTLALSVCCLSSGLLFAGGIAANAAEETDRTGEMIFAQCEEYINIRSEADTDSEVVAKIYNNGAATILEQEDEWYKIQSGNAVGYVKAEYFAVDEEAQKIAQEVAYHVAVVHPEDLNVRTSPSEDTEVLEVAHAKEELEVVDYDGDWMKLALGGELYGYVNAYYVDYKTYYPQAETLEEEQARLEAEAAALEAQLAAAESAASEENAEWTEEDSWEAEASADDDLEASAYDADAAADQIVAENTAAEPTYTETAADQTADNTAATEQTNPVSAEQTESAAADNTAAAGQTAETEASVSETVSTDSSLGQQIADYAVQFIGNPYVWGGTSLTSGADCSGFTQSVFANFGISLARVAADQSYGGTSVSLDSLQPGDLLFYSSSGSIDHVAIYIGGGTIVHAANAKSGITTSSYNYSTPVAARRYF